MTLGYNDYYPFGMLVPNRYSSDSYRYGFQGQEKDDEIKGEGNSLNFKYRMHDPRVGRFFATDPLLNKYPYLTPYQFGGNRPIDMIELEGLEATLTKQHDVYFVELKNATAGVIVRKSNQTISETLKINDKPNKDDYSINLNFYELNDESYYSKYKYRTSSEPQPINNFTAQGQIIVDGKKIAGKTAPKTFYFAKKNDVWTAGEGNPPNDASVAFGGGVPVYVKGTKYGVGNIPTSDAPEGIPNRGNPNNVPLKYFKQKNYDAYMDLNAPDKGKTILAFRSKDKTWMIVSQEDGSSGMSLDAIRDNLITKGYDNIMAFDGSNSSTLINNKKTLVEPGGYKDNAIPVGLTISAPEKKTKK